MVAIETRSEVQLTPDLIALFDLIRKIDTHQRKPTALVNVGRWQDRAEVLIEALEDSFETYQRERAQLFNEFPEVGALFSSYGTPEQKPRTLINLRELRNRPRPQWVIEGFIYENTIIELYAEAGCYKSFLSFDWSARISLEKDTKWLGYVNVVKHGLVVYIAAEGADGYIARADAWCKHNNISFDELSKNFYFWPEPLPLNNSAEVAHFIEEVTDTLRENNHVPQLIVIDTLLRCSDGQNINLPDVMGAIFKGTDTIKRTLNVPNVLIVHHSGKDQRLGGMGSVVLKNNCDCVYSMSKDAATNSQVILKAEKMKDKPELTTYLRTEKVYYGELPIEDESSLVLVPGEKPSKENKPKLSQKQTTMLAILDEHKSLTYAEWLHLYEAQGGKKRTFDDNRKTFQDNKTIEEYAGKYRRYVAPLQGDEEEQADDE